MLLVYVRGLLSNVEWKNAEAIAIEHGGLPARFSDSSSRSFGIQRNIANRSIGIAERQSLSRHRGAGGHHAQTCGLRSHLDIDRRSIPAVGDHLA